MADKIAELTSDGLVTQTENEIYERIIAKMQDIDPNFNLDTSSPDMMMAAFRAELYREMNEALEQAYISKDRRSAKGTQLDILGALIGDTREDGTGVVYNVTLTGTEGTEIPNGSVITKSDYTFLTDEAVTIGSAGTIATTATCTTTGAITVNTGTANIGYTIAGWTAVTLDSVSVEGTDQQSNALYRAEQNKAVAKPGNNQVDNMLAQIYSVDDVLRAIIYENDTDSSDYDEDENPYSLPKNSITIIVQGGDDVEVAEAIFIKKNPGVKMNVVGDSTVSETVTSENYSSNSQVIKYSRPTLVDMIIAITLEDPDENLPSDIEDLIQDAILSYVDGALIDEDDGFDGTGFDIGEDVPVSRLNTPINQVVGQYKGAYIDALEVNSQTSGKVSIDYYELANFTSDNITVAVN